MTEENNLNDENGDDQKPFLNVLVHSFFVIPFLIAVFCVLLFVSMHLLTREKRSAFDYLEDVKTGGLTKRWQGAFELSKFLANSNEISQNPRFIAELTNAFEQSLNDDPRIRQYLALAMGRTGNRDFFDTLTKSIDEENPQTLYAIIYTLGMLKDQRAEPILIKFLKEDDSRLRSMAVVALGSLESTTSISHLKKMLNDVEPNVQWGAAISLANLESLAGEEILLKLLDRGYYSQFEEVDVYEQNDLILTAIEAAKNIRSKNLVEKIKWLAQNDPNMKVKSAALNFE